MRINRFVASCTGMSRRDADKVIAAGRVKVDGFLPSLSVDISDQKVTLDGKPLTLKELVTLALNKPVGYVVSRDGQGSKTIYDLLPNKFQNLKPVGRLDKDSSGLLLLTNDGQLANQLTHPKFQKQKTYIIKLDKELTDTDMQKIEAGIELEDGTSQLKLKGSGLSWQVEMSEGRNRQIRRTFQKLGYRITSLNRTEFGEFKLDNMNLPVSKYTIL